MFDIEIEFETVRFKREKNPLIDDWFWDLTDEQKGWWKKQGLGGLLSAHGKMQLNND
jgi:hypothetical protein